MRLKTRMYTFITTFVIAYSLGLFWLAEHPGDMVVKSIVNLVVDDDGTTIPVLLQNASNVAESNQDDRALLTLQNSVLGVGNQLLNVNTTYSLPTIYAISPTYTRSTQKADLVRLSQTFRQIRNFHWILVEDSLNKTALVGRLLNRSGINFTHLNSKTPQTYPDRFKNESKWSKPRGLEQRNAGIEWLLQNTSNDSHGVVYFADDDNTYDLQIFEEMRDTKRVSVWPVGLVGARIHETPKVKDGKVIGWNVGWGFARKFPLDMAAFAVNLELLRKKPLARFSIHSPPGYLESEIVRQLVTLSELEPKADNCTKVYVWHTKTVQMKVAYKLKSDEKPMEV